MVHLWLHLLSRITKIQQKCLQLLIFTIVNKLAAFLCDATKNVGATIPRFASSAHDHLLKHAELRVGLMLSCFTSIQMMVQLMTHSPDFGPESWRRKSVPTSGLCIIPIWYQIFMVPYSGTGRLRVLHGSDFWYDVTTMATDDSFMPLFSFCLYSLVILLFVVCFIVHFCVVCVDFRRRFFRTISHLVWNCSAPTLGDDLRRRFLVCVSSALRTKTFNNAS